MAVVAQDYAQPPNVRTNTYQVSQSGATTNYAYDSNGHLTSDGTKTYEWDAENRLVRVAQGATELARFAYDGLGRRHQKVAGGVTHSYVYDGWSIVQERLSTGSTIDFVQGLAIDQVLARREGAVVSYYLADHLGSVVGETSSSGAMSLTREYDPYGNLVQGLGTSGFAFTGREWDAEIGQYHYRARYYSPATGKFLSDDPIGLDGGTNLAAYVSNNPVSLVDPLGLKPRLRDFFFNPIRCIGGMSEAGQFAWMVLSGQFPDRNGDKRAHCLAFCKISKGCGPFWGGFVLTAGVGFGKEAFDSFCFYYLRPELGGHFNINVPCYTPWDTRDINANFHGANACPTERCEERCSDAPQRF